ncbi:ragulator complex protein LAMTOR5 homolog [Mercenaria mercenaria]|uniref:ragulator complex protein LAMTOR5 homolog n=1 Tax=Mercenaria mercenaria TaxID=6596 RepID=UPI001E1E08DB|nr:ragulator complex protein LAMTOR5 homolog [Mercenaria mercenaria]
MERNLDKHLDDTFRVPGVAGVICTDEHGLCLGAKGIATRESAGHIANIAESAARLNPNMPNPVISIEGEGGSILIKKEDNITMGIYKSPN